MLNLIGKLARNRDGNFALLTALIAVPVTAAAGIAIDFANAYGTRADLQTALDAAVLAAASSGQTDEDKLRTIVDNVFLANLQKNSGENPKVTDFAVSPDRHISARAQAEAAVTLASIIQPNGINVAVTAEALAGSEDKIEIALVLDNTYSMVGKPLTDLKAASNALLDVFEKIDKDKSMTRFSLVPFSRYVNVGMSYRNASWMSVANDTSTTKEVCSTSRPVISQTCTTKKETRYNDGVPYQANVTTCTNQVYGDPVKTCKMQTSTVKWTGCVGSRTNPLDTNDVSPDKKYTGMMNTSCGAALTTLTNDYKSLRKSIAAMVANDETFIAPGIMWGWNTLSSTEPFTHGAAYDADVKKFIVLMTDGTNTVYPSYPGHSNKDGKDAVKAAAQIEKSDALLQSVCANAKDKKVTIFTVAVGISPSSSTAVALGKCATDSEKALIISDSAKLVATFEEIAAQIMSPRLTN